MQAQEQEEHSEVSNLTVTSIEDRPSRLKLIDLRCSSWNKTFRITALIFQVTRTWRKKKTTTQLTTTDITEARNALIKATQQSHYVEEIKHITNKAKGKTPTLIHQLGPSVYENGIVRCHGRLKHSDLPETAKYPILLLKDDYLTTLVVQAMHKKIMHGGTGETLTHIRQAYWIPQGRQLVKKLIHRCVTCRKI